MLKHIIALIVLSLLAVLGIAYAHQAVEILLSVHNWISDTLMEVFAGGEAGSLAKNIIAILSVPILIGLIPALLYWMIKRSWFPYFMQIVWIVWLIQISALAIAYKLV